MTLTDAKKENKYPGKLSLPANELLALSDFIQDEFEKNHGIRPLHLIDPGLDTTQFAPFRGTKDIDLLAAGSLIPLKQFELFLEIVADLKKQRPELKAALIGGGPGKELLESIVRARGLGSSVTLTGELPYENVLALMQRARIFLHTSNYEGFGMVCAEALYAGAHVISFVQPMKKTALHWHFASDKQEMTAKSLALLQDPATSYQPVLYKNIEETARQMMALFSK